MIDLRQMRHAVTLADRGTYAAAAQALGITQPALTRSIQAIEAAYGLVLFDRGRLGAIPTEAGEEFLARARTLLEDARELDRSMAEQRAGLSGEVRFGLGPLVASATLPATIPAIVAQYPGLELTITVSGAAALLQQLGNGVLQFAILPANLAVRGDFRIAPLGRLPLCFIARAGHPLGPGPASAERIAAYPLLGGNFATTQAAARAGGGDYRPQVSCDNYEILRGLTGTGDYLWVTSPAVVAAELADGRMIRIDCPDVLDASYEVALVTRRRGAMSRAAASVASRLAATLAPYFIEPLEGSPAPAAPGHSPGNGIPTG